MSFTANNNVIRVTDTNGDVVFDTSTPMPHIVQQINTSVTHTFPESGDQQSIANELISELHSGCRDYKQVCRNNYICTMETRTVSKYTCEYEYVCEWTYIPGLGNRYDCGYKNVCKYRWVQEQYEYCRYEYQCNWEWVDVEGYQSHASNTIMPLENSTVYNLGNVPTGTNPDFLITLATFNRTNTGYQRDYGNFVSAIPNGKKITAVGTTILENSFQPGGQSWLSRIVSVYVDGDSIKAEFKHSNRSYAEGIKNSERSCVWYPQINAPPANTSSTWMVDFEVYVGKYTT